MSIDIDLVLVKSEAFALQIPRAGSRETCVNIYIRQRYIWSMLESHTKYMVSSDNEWIMNGSLHSLTNPLLLCTCSRIS